MIESKDEQERLLAQFTASQILLKRLEEKNEMLAQKIETGGSKFLKMSNGYEEMVEKMKEEAKETNGRLKVIEKSLQQKEETLKDLEKEMETMSIKAKESSKTFTLVSESLASVRKEKEYLALELEKIKLSHSLSREKVDHQKEIWNLEKDKLLLKIQTLETRLLNQPMALAVCSILNVSLPS